MLARHRDRDRAAEPAAEPARKGQKVATAPGLAPWPHSGLRPRPMPSLARFTTRPDDNTAPTRMFEVVQKFGTLIPYKRRSRARYLDSRRDAFRRASVSSARSGVRRPRMRRRRVEAVREDNGDELRLVPARQLELAVLVLDLIEEPRGLSMTSWAAKFCTGAICLSVNGPAFCDRRRSRQSPCAAQQRVVYLEVRVLPGPPRSRALPEIS
jgi:hypothetical protein